MITSAKDLAIPRPIVASTTKPVEIHTFVDASHEPFAAAEYARSNFNWCFVVRLVAAKSKVAPTKALSIPRLELQAAVLGARLAVSVIKSFD